METKEILRKLVSFNTIRDNMQNLNFKIEKIEEIKEKYIKI